MCRFEAFREDEVTDWKRTTTYWICTFSNNQSLRWLVDIFSLESCFQFHPLNHLNLRILGSELLISWGTISRRSLASRTKNPLSIKLCTKARSKEPAWSWMRRRIRGVGTDSYFGGVCRSDIYWLARKWTSPSGPSGPSGPSCLGLNRLLAMTREIFSAFCNERLTLLRLQKKSSRDIAMFTSKLFLSVSFCLSNFTSNPCRFLLWKSPKGRSPHEAMPLTRSWCLFEILQTIFLKKQVIRFQGLFFCTETGAAN